MTDNHFSLQKRLRRIFSILLILGIPVLCFGESSALDEYKTHVFDLKHFGDNGYKDSFKDIHIQGAIRITGRTLDCAILGSGFFQFYDPSSEALYYSRDGAFFRNDDGFLVNGDGFYLMPQIHLPEQFLEQNLSIKHDGEIQYRSAHTDTYSSSRIILYQKEGESYQKMGNYFLFDAVVQDDDSEIVPQALELNNYNIDEKLVHMRELLIQLKRENLLSEKEYKKKISLIRLLEDYSGHYDTFLRTLFAENKNIDRTKIQDIYSEQIEAYAELLE